MERLLHHGIDGVDGGVLPLMSLSDCIVDGNIDPQRLLRFQKRSHNELLGLLLSNSLLQQEEDHANNVSGGATEVSGSRNQRRSKKKRKEKQVVMFTDPHTGVRLLLYPTMSLWCVCRVLFYILLMSYFLTCASYPT